MFKRDKRKKTITLVLAIVVLTFIALIVVSNLTTSSQTPPLTQPRTQIIPPPPPTVESLLAATNKERAIVGAPPLQLDQRLNNSAQLKADDMATNNYFGHINPVTGVNGANLIQTTGILCQGGSGGENLTRNSTVNTSEQAIFSFMSSKPHKDAMLNPVVELVGFGINNGHIAMHMCATIK